MAYSYSVAEEICEDFEDLIDTEFHFEGRLLMAERVLVAPHGAEQCEQFFSACMAGADAATLIADHEGSEFDVIIVVSEADDATVLSYLRIAAYIADKGVHYNFPE